MIDLNPWGELYTAEMEEAKVCIMGVPFDGAVSCGKGAAQAPEKIRALSRYLPPFTELGDKIDKIRIFDAGDVAADLDWTRYYSDVEAEAYRLLLSDKFCLFLGGDHSVTIPLHKAFGHYCRDNGKKKIGIIHFDSHYDLCDTYDGHKWSHACTERRALEGVVQPENLSFAGIRSAEEQETLFVADNPSIMVIKAADLYRDGWKHACDRLIQRYEGYDAVYFTLDIDFLDPASAPGTGTPEVGGPTSRELLEMVKVMLRDINITVMDIVEVSPPLDVNDLTSWAALKVIYEVLGVLNAK